VVEALFELKAEFDNDGNNNNNNNNIIIIIITTTTAWLQTRLICLLHPAIQEVPTNMACNIALGAISWRCWKKA
jgi:hypothetical protein